MTIGERIKYVRKERGLTLESFGNRLGISAPSVSKLERGLSNPSDQTVMLICRAFHVRADWLLGGVGSMWEERSQEDALWEDLTSIMTAGNDDFRKRLISLLVQMPSENWRVLEDMAKELMTHPENVQPSQREGEDIHA